MQTFDVSGQFLHPKLFISIFREVLKIAPARFLTLRIHPDRYNDLYKLADVPESIQVGTVPGMLGRMVLKVNCIKPPIGVSDGIQILKDPKADTTKLVFELHGIPEFIVIHLAPFVT
jgi:hypothetical protein